MTIDAMRAARRSGLILALSGLLLPAAPLHAEGYEAQLRYGQAGSSDYEGAGISLRLPAWWTAKPSGWTMNISPEVEFTRFRYSGNQGDDHMNEAGALGVFRIERGEGAVRPYAEAGLGIAGFSRKDLGNKQFSTRYQFTEQVGLGLRFGGRWSAGWRYSHYSNADIETPNDGIDLQQIMLGVSF